MGPGGPTQVDSIGLRAGELKRSGPDRGGMCRDAVTRAWPFSNGSKTFVEGASKANSPPYRTVIVPIHADGGMVPPLLGGPADAARGAFRYGAKRGRARSLRGCVQVHGVSPIRDLDRSRPDRGGTKPCRNPRRPAGPRPGAGRGGARRERREPRAGALPAARARRLRPAAARARGRAPAPARRRAHAGRRHLLPGHRPRPHRPARPQARRPHRCPGRAGGGPRRGCPRADAARPRAAGGPRRAGRCADARRLHPAGRERGGPGLPPRARPGT